MNTNDVLTLLRRYDEFAELMKKRNPNILADIISYKLNPNCTCKAKILSFFGANPLEMDYIESWVKSKGDTIDMTPPTLPIQNPKLSPEDIKKLKDERPRMVLKSTLPQPLWSNYVDVIGQSYEIEPNPDKYKELMTIAREQWFYNGLSVLETVKTNPVDNSEKMVWVIFFY